MKVFLSLIFVAIAVSMVLPVYATHFGDCPHTDLECIATFDDAEDFGDLFTGTGSVIINEETFQGTNLIANSMSSFSFLEWTLNFQDGIETGTTEFTSSVFQPFTLSFTDEGNQFRTLIDAEVRAVTSYSGIGSGFCHDLPRTTHNVQTFVNGAEIDIIKQLFGSNEFNESTALNKGFGVKFTPLFIEGLLMNAGVNLQTGDIITWKVTTNNRFTVYVGEETGGVCEAVRGIAWDAFVTGMSYQINFVYAEPFDLITIPVTSEPDLDGDGIPDSIDQCDFSGERYNGFQDEDGCPDEDPIGFTGTISDRDGDGILDEDDQCPNDGENFNGVEDGDGCPDGSVLDVNFGSVPITETIDPFVDTEGNIVTSQEITEIAGLDPLPADEIELVEGDPFTFIHQEENEEAITVAGSTVFCDRSIENCDQIFATAIVTRTGFDVPFDLSILNLIIISGVAVVAVLIMMRLIKKK